MHCKSMLWMQNSNKLLVWFKRTILGVHNLVPCVCHYVTVSKDPPPVSNTYSTLHIELSLCLLIGSLALLQIENVN
jgi:hypothetical protein